MEIRFGTQALEDLSFFEKSGNGALQRKIKSLLVELSEHPTTGTGKPERLRDNLSGYWSRRINVEHRIIYKIDPARRCVDIYSLRGHYDA